MTVFELSHIIHPCCRVQIIEDKSSCTIENYFNTALIPDKEDKIITPLGDISQWNVEYVKPAMYTYDFIDNPTVKCMLVVAISKPNEEKYMEK